MGIKIEVTSVKSLVKLVGKFFEVSNSGQEEVSCAAIKSAATDIEGMVFFEDQVIFPLLRDTDFMCRLNLPTNEWVEHFLEKGARVSFESNFLGFHYMCFYSDDDCFISESQFLNLVKRTVSDIEIIIDRTLPYLVKRKNTEGL